MRKQALGLLNPRPMILHAIQFVTIFQILRHKDVIDLVLDVDWACVSAVILLCGKRLGNIISLKNARQDKPSHGCPLLQQFPRVLDGYIPKLRKYFSSFSHSGSSSTICANSYGSVLSDCGLLYCAQCVVDPSGYLVCQQILCAGGAQQSQHNMNHSLTEESLADAAANRILSIGAARST